MGTGTLVRTYGLTKEALADNTVDCGPQEVLSTEEGMEQQLLEARFGPELFYRTRNGYIADSAHFATISRGGGYVVGTGAGEWDTIHAEVSTRAPNVWDTPRLKELSAQPLGAPIELTPEEAEEIVRLAAGRRPDLPAGKGFVAEVRELLGHSLIERLRKTE